MIHLRRMSDVARFFGNSPRARLLEGLVRLGPGEFTRSEIADEAGLFRGSANRHIDGLVRDGLLAEIKGGRGWKKYRVANEPRLQLVAYFDSALGILERRRPLPTPAPTIVGRFREAAARMAAETYADSFCVDSRPLPFGPGRSVAETCSPVTGSQALPLLLAEA